MTERAKKLLLLYYKQSKKNRTIQGSPPLTFKAKKAGTLNNYRIYGNTVNGESVGEKTANLFDGELTDGYHLSDTTGLPVSFARRFATSQPITINQSEYCLTYNSTTDLRFMYSVFNNDTLIRRAAIVNNRYLQSGDAIDTTGGNKIYFAFYNNDYLHASTGMISNIMLNEGSTALPYEPYGYKVPVTVEGKNLLQNTATSQTINGVTFTVNADGRVTCNGTATERIGLRINTTMFQSGDYICSNNIQGSSTSYYVDWVIQAASSMTLKEYGQAIKITTNEPVKVIAWINIASGYNCDNLTFYPMIRKADIEDDTYEPYYEPVTANLYLPEQIKMVGDEAEYVDYKEQKQHRVRKNLLQNTATSQTTKGVTFTVNDDGSITCNGTASGAIYFSFAINLESGTYIISGTPRGMTDDNAILFINANHSTIGLSNNVIDNYGNGKQFVATQSGTATLTITIKSGYTCDNLTFYPMVRKADIEDDTYEPYIENTDLDVTLPALPVLPGTNTLTVGTEVQPSSVEIKGRIKAAGGD